MDVNGNVLWEKQLGNGSKAWMIIGLDTTKDGGIIITGVCDTLNQQYNPYVIKLNACGQIEWCKIYNTENQDEFGIKILSLTDNTYMLLIQSWGNDTIGQYVQLNHLNATGDVIWEQKYFVQDSLGYPLDENGFYKTSDQKYLVTGICYHTIAGQSQPWWPWSMLILADSTGESAWELPWGYTIPFSTEVMGEGFQSLQVSSTIYSAISDYHSATSNVYSPCLIKTTFNGTEMSYKDLIDSTSYGKSSTISMLYDSV
jgi:hypothetical protein